MRIGIPTETRPGETRVAATPETVKKLTAGKLHEVLVQSGAGVGANAPDKDYAAAGATIVATAAEAYQADLVLKVRGPDANELPLLRAGSILIALLTPHDQAGIAALAQKGVTGFALEKLPRITRAMVAMLISTSSARG